MPNIWPIHHNTPSSEFIDSLRDWAISNRVDERFIHRLDELGSVEDVQAELDTLQNDLSEMEDRAMQAEDNADMLREALKALCDACNDAASLDAITIPTENAYKVIADEARNHK